MRSGFVRVARLATVAACGGEGPAEQLEKGELPAGRYETSAFEPKVSLELPAGWASLHEGEAFFDVHRPLAEPASGGPAWDVAVLVARVDGDAAPGDVIDELEGNPSLEVECVCTAELDGAEGLKADVAARSESIPVFFPGKSLSALPGRRLRVYAVDVRGRTVVVVVDAAAESFAEDAATVEPVLHTMAFG